MQRRNVILVKLKKKVYATILSDGLKQITDGSIQGDDDNVCWNLLIFLFLKYHCTLRQQKKNKRVKHNPEIQCQMNQYVNYLRWRLTSKTSPKIPLQVGESECCDVQCPHPISELLQPHSRSVGGQWALNTFAASPNNPNSTDKRRPCSQKQWKPDGFSIAAYCLWQYDLFWYDFLNWW